MKGLSETHPTGRLNHVLAIWQHWYRRLSFSKAALCNKEPFRLTMKYNAIGLLPIVASYHSLLFGGTAQAVNKLSKILLVTKNAVYVSNEKETVASGQPR